MKNDARTRYTRGRIVKAFYDALRGKPLPKVTVREICDRAEINRATFYHHYLDTYDLLEKLEAEILEELRRNIRWVMVSGERDAMERFLEEIRNIRQEEVPVPIFRIFEEDPSFSMRLMEVLYQESALRMDERLSDLTADEREMVYRFMISGGGGVLNQWVNGALDVTAAQVTNALYRMSEGLIGAVVPETRRITWREGNTGGRTNK